MVAHGDRAFEGQRLPDVGADLRRERLEPGERQRGEVDPRVVRGAHRSRNGLVRVAERHAFPHQVVGEVGGGRVSLKRGGAHGLGHRGQARDQAGEDGERGLERRRRIEQRLLVFLVVLVVRERLALHQREERHQAAEHAPAFSAHQLGHVGILLLRHDRRAGAVAVGEAHETEARARPEHELLGKARKMHHHQRCGGGKLDREVAIGYGVQRIFRHALEAELACDARPVDAEARAGERRGAERQAIDPRAHLAQPFPVALQHRDIRHHMVAEGHRLRDLQVGEARHHQRCVPLGLREQGLDEAHEQRIDGVDLGAQPEAQVGGDLVVARAPGMQALARIADQRGQAPLDVEVHVLVVERPLEAARLDLAAHLREAAHDGGHVAAREDPARAEHARVRERAGDVERREAPVESDRGGEFLDQRVDRLPETTGPKLLLLGHAPKMLCR